MSLVMLAPYGRPFSGYYCNCNCFTVAVVTQQQIMLCIWGGVILPTCQCLLIGAHCCCLQVCQEQLWHEQLPSPCAQRTMHTLPAQHVH